MKAKVGAEGAGCCARRAISGLRESAEAARTSPRPFRNVRVAYTHRMVFVLLACVARSGVPVAEPALSVANPDVRVEAVIPPPPPDPLTILLAGSTGGTEVAVGVDARAMTNAWRVEYNRGVGLMDKGDAVGALAAARTAVRLAPADARSEALILAAAAAGQSRDVPAELAALELLGDEPGVPWGLLYNGSLDAQAAGRPDLASRYALAAMARADDPAVVAPMALRAALTAGDLDGALRAAPRASADPIALAQLARALALAGRCEEAQVWDAGQCGRSPHEGQAPGQPAAESPTTP